MNDTKKPSSKSSSGVAAGDSDQHDPAGGSQPSTPGQMPGPPGKAIEPDNDAQADPRATDQTAPGEEADSAAQDPLSQLEPIQRERDTLREKLLLAMADYQNLARRTEQNIVTAREQSLMEITKQLVTVLDHFDRALEIDPDSTSTEGFLKGVMIVRDELLKTLQNFGVDRLDVPAGEPFDPNRHEAMMRQASDEIESNHVTAQLQPGYTIGNKTIRPAKVCVAE